MIAAIQAPIIVLSPSAISADHMPGEFCPMASAQPLSAATKIVTATCRSSSRARAATRLIV
jgi:hypothetical protein